MLIFHLSLNLDEKLAVGYGLTCSTKTCDEFNVEHLVSKVKSNSDSEISTNLLSGSLIRSLSSWNHNEPSILKGFSEVLKRLKADIDVVITKSDKTNQIIVNKMSYRERSNEQLNNSNTYEKLSGTSLENKTKQYNQGLNRILRKFKLTKQF